jgi:mannonate dehydratase
LHLRNVQREPNGSFYEAEHLAGSTDMCAVMENIALEQLKRVAAGRTDIAIPLRPDHGHKYWMITSVTLTRVILY